MARAARPWFRFYVEAPTDMKIRRLHVKHRWLWVCVLGAARQSPKPGWLVIHKTVVWDEKDLAQYADISIKDVREGLAAMVQLKLVEQVDGVWHVPAWDERQYEGDFARSKIPEDLRAEVLARDGGACVECSSTDDLQIDHIVPVTKGGADDVDNLQVLCGLCNRRKSDRIRQQNRRDKSRDVDRDNHVTPSVSVSGCDVALQEEEGALLDLVVADAPSDPVLVVFEAWVVSTGKSRCVLSADRRRVIERALKLYPVEDCVDAVRGWKHSPHHRGENTNRTIYNDIELLLRNAKQIENFRDLERGGNRPATPVGKTLTAASELIIDG